MKKGLVLGKFMPIQNGHLGLIDFGLNYCDELIVLICAATDEPIDAQLRLQWVELIFKTNQRVKPRVLIYNENDLPNTSVSSEKVSKLWADYLKQHIERIDIVFASEKYGEYLAGFLNCEYLLYDVDRLTTPVSSSQIRDRPFKYWDFIPDVVKPYFVKKICLYGTESTGKTTFTKKLAEHFNTAHVPEMARDILENTVECTEDHLMQIAGLHAKTINETVATANKLLFVDTDVNITRSYCKFLFNKELCVPEWIETANKFDLYLYLDNDAPYVQDGTRLNEEERNRLNTFHRHELESRGRDYVLLQGNWDERLNKAVSVINNLFY